MNEQQQDELLLQEQELHKIIVMLLHKFDPLCTGIRITPADLEISRKHFQDDDKCNFSVVGNSEGFVLQACSEEVLNETVESITQGATVTLQ
jgi:hypothetical protein